MTGELARCRAVSHRFGATLAVADVDLDVGPGEVVGLLGANGAGKTTLIRILLGLLRPSAGAVRLFGEPPSRRTRGRIGYVPQTAGVYDDLTAEENLAFTRAAFGTAAGPLPEALRVPEGVPAGRLGLGMQRRLAFAVAYCHGPGLFVLDEPTSGVDALTRTRLWDVIRQAAEGGAGVLVTTHSMEEAQECDRLVMMAAGRRIAEGTVAGIVGTARVTTVDCADWPAALRALEGAGLRAALAGRLLRVPGAEPQRVRAALAGLPAVVGGPGEPRGAFRGADRRGGRQPVTGRPVPVAVVGPAPVTRPAARLTRPAARLTRPAARRRPGRAPRWPR